MMPTGVPCRYGGIQYVYNAHSLHILTCYFSHQTVRQLGRVFVGEVQRDVVHKRLGYSNSWINQRLKSIEIRKDLTRRMETARTARGSAICYPH